MTDPVKRTERLDFRATSDPALQDAADRGEAHLLTYRELYELWERQQWAVQDLDFSQDRIDWHERIDAEERVARMYGLSSFFVGEQRVAAELGPIMRAVPGYSPARASSACRPPRLSPRSRTSPRDRAARRPRRRPSSVCARRRGA